MKQDTVSHAMAYVVSWRAVPHPAVTTALPLGRVKLVLELLLINCSSDTVRMQQPPQNRREGGPGRKAQTDGLSPSLTTQANVKKMKFNMEKMGGAQSCLPTATCSSWPMCAPNPRVLIIMNTFLKRI